MQTLSHNIEDYPEGLVLPIDKPYRWTSADVIRKIKWAACRHFKNKKLKVGHAGTLDPLATGILLVCIGKATKRADELQRSPKQYIAGVSFGATTASYDLEKEVLDHPIDTADAFSRQRLSREQLEAVLPRFIGEQEQIAPLFSAKSVDGVRVYEMARKLYKEGKSLENSDILQSSRISIYDLQVLEWTDTVPLLEPEAPLGLKYGKRLCCSSTGDDRNKINVASTEGMLLPTALLQVDCSKGCYIRALARDLGEALESAAFLSSLRRTRNGGYDISQAISMDDALQMLAAD